MPTPIGLLHTVDNGRGVGTHALIKTTRTGKVAMGLLVEIDADSGPSRAAELLAGLGFSTADQVSNYFFRTSSHLSLTQQSNRRVCLHELSQEDGECVFRSLEVSPLISLCRKI